MQSITKKYRKTFIVLGIIFSPFAFYFTNMILLSLFNFGTYIGTFLRELFNLVG